MKLLGMCICSLRPDIVIHRLTGDGPKQLLVAFCWTWNKRQVLNGMQRYFKEQNIWQGKEFIHGRNIYAIQVNYFIYVGSSGFSID